MSNEWRITKEEFTYTYECYDGYEWTVIKAIEYASCYEVHLYCDHTDSTMVLDLDDFRDLEIV